MSLEANSISFVRPRFRGDERGESLVSTSSTHVQMAR
jgi:hypothetical protein